MLALVCAWTTWERLSMMVVYPALSFLLLARLKTLMKFQAFIPDTIVLPISGICFNQESCQRGGVPALATRASLGMKGGNVIFGNSGTIQFGQSIDQSTAF